MWFGLRSHEIRPTRSSTVRNFRNTRRPSTVRFPAGRWKTFAWLPTIWMRPSKSTWRHMRVGDYSHLFGLMWIWVFFCKLPPEYICEFEWMSIYLAVGYNRLGYAVFAGQLVGYSRPAACRPHRHHRSHVSDDADARRRFRIRHTDGAGKTMSAMLYQMRKNSIGESVVYCKTSAGRDQHRAVQCVSTVSISTLAGNYDYQIWP